MKKILSLNLHKIEFALAVAVFVAAGAVAAQQYRTLIEDRQAVAHTLKVLDAETSALALAEDAETGERGYVITGDPTYLEPYDAAIAPDGIYASLQRLGVLTSDNPIQEQRVGDILQQVGNDLILIQEAIDLRKHAGFAPAEAFEATGRPKQTMDAIRTLFSEMTFTEDQLLRDRTSSTAAAVRTTTIVLATGGLLSLALLVFAFSGLNRQIKHRRRAEEELRLLNDELEKRVEKRTKELGEVNLELNRLNRALRTLSQGNQALVRSETERELLDDVCDNITDAGGYSVVWIGHVDQGNDRLLRPVAWSGIERSELEGLRHEASGDNRAVPPSDSAVRAGTAIVVNDLLNDERFAPWREIAVRKGLASAISLPLGRGPRPFGVLTIGSAEPNSFMPQEINLLTELAGDLSFGIEAIKTKEARRTAEEQAKTRLRNLSALREIDLAIMGATDPRISLATVLAQVSSQINVDACDILELGLNGTILTCAADRGFTTTMIRRTQIALGKGAAGKAALERHTVLIPNVNLWEEHFERQGLMTEEEFVGYAAVPLITQGRVNGILEVFHRGALELDQDRLSFLEVLAGQAAIAVSTGRLFEELNRSRDELLLSYDSTIEGWSRALDLRDKETEGHSQRVTELTLLLAREMKMTERQLLHVRRGALLHDIGKMGIPDSILLKPGSLTEEEWEIMRRHPVYSYELLSPIPYLHEALDIPYCHHEKWDGTGYPRRLKGEQIPIAARLFAVVDVWDALRSDRPYRPAWSEEKVREHIKGLSGTHFDPQAVEVFLTVTKGRPESRSC